MGMEQKNIERIRRPETDTGQKKQGKLKIFFGYAAGVGKTQAMLTAALKAERNGMDVVSGYIEPHTNPEILELMEGIEKLPLRHLRRAGNTFLEFDLDAALKRNPELILVDGLAHSNAIGCRHEKRYQDVEELLQAGIDVYTTVNVQHIESLNDLVASVTGFTVLERIPDSIFDRADQVEIVDTEPQELINRLQEDKISDSQQEQQSSVSFFTIQKLNALREIALRRFADWVSRRSERNGAQKDGLNRQEEHILVCLSSSPSNAKIIRTAARMAQAFKGAFTALFVETPDFPAMSRENLQRLRANTRLAEQLGAKIETVYGPDVPFQIAEFARLSSASRIVIGSSSASRGHFFSGQTLTDKLIAIAPQMDIHIIPDSTAGKSYHPQKLRKYKLSVADILKSAGILLLASLVGGIFDCAGFEEANIIIVYVLGCLIISVVTQSRIYSLGSSLISVLIFNFLFTEPRWSLKASDTGYPVTFIIMFFAAFLTSTLAEKLKEHAKQSALVAFRNKILFDVNQSLQQANDRDEIMSAAATHLNRLLRQDVVIYPAEDGKLQHEKVFYADPNGEHAVDYGTESERAVAQWVFKNNKHAGATTQTLAYAKCLYLAIRIGQKVFGVAGIATGKTPIDSGEKSIVLSILGECALALENNRNAREKEEAAIMAQKEQLRANLLRTISHDLRTPLTSISGNASNFLSNGDMMDRETKRQLFTDIYDDSMWLINLVENLLSVTRLEENNLNLHFSSELVADVIDEALQHINRRSTEYHISVHHEDEFLMAEMDAKLIVQVMINLIDNAIKYTPTGSKIDIKTAVLDGKAVISVSDNGDGIPDDMKPKIFDMFYSGANRVADSRRSLGLGLSLCKSIVTAHSGEISVSDNKPHGTVFTFTLPMKDIKIYEQADDIF